MLRAAWLPWLDLCRLSVWTDAELRHATRLRRAWSGRPGGSLWKCVGVHDELVCGWTVHRCLQRERRLSYRVRRELLGPGLLCVGSAVRKLRGAGAALHQRAWDAPVRRELRDDQRLFHGDVSYPQRLLARALLPADAWGV